MAYSLRATPRARLERAPGPLWLVALLGACGGDGDDTETRRYENIGDIALAPADGAMTVSVLFDECLSSCNKNVGSCSARAADGSVTIETLLEVTLDNDRNGVCNSACAQATATCQLENPPSGTYSIHSGLRSARIELPVSATTQVIGDGIYNP